MPLKVIITGATGMAGEGVLLECLQNDAVSEVLMVNRKHSGIKHARLKELIVPDFLEVEAYSTSLEGYDACFFCAGISSVGMSEEKYTLITYDTTMRFAKTLVAINPGMVFNYITGSHTDSTEKGKLMWARVKGRTENDLMKLPFKAQYNFRPGGMEPVKGQKNAKAIYVAIIRIIRFFSSKGIISLHELGRAMINAVIKGYPKQVLEISDIKALAAR
ncbi:NAD-dependent epimerase/dehydratase family protein [Hufsiella ginkgonis]|uniref:NAD-dependent epimerase/dehydratase family protein n=1 Tax=Hufsiella ginkgonis TaxID=2695274 RepID=A0A7K1XXH1_9SPHI|nr:NAD-dependent epimerase/dehydratase family protein [Hufsiella ginkgonis]MXV15642.1 NAD-dependent epimerase/dehydratase family protein [Hufsiella ginkgonis]